MKKILAFFLCLTMLLGLLSGCDRPEEPYVPTGDGLSDQPGVKPPPTVPPQGEETQTGLAYYKDRSLNPFLSTDDTNRVLFSLIYQGLFSVDRNYEVHPILCKKYNVSADMKTYTFYIEKALFSDGTPLRAEDVEASFHAARESSRYKGRLQHISGISCYGDAVVVELSIPVDNLPILMDFPIVKASQVEDESPLGTGPYRIDGDRLRRQAGWWCSAELPVDADTIALVEVSSPAQIRDSFVFGQTSLAATNPGSRDYVDFHSDYELWECETGLFLYLVCNSKSTFFANDALRAALTRAIDRDSLVESCYRGFARSAALPASPLSPYYNSALAARYGYAPQVFGEALAAAAPESMEITLLLNADDPTRLKAGEAIAAMLKTHGINVTIVEATGSNFVSLLKKGNYDLYLAQTRLSPNMDLSAFFGQKTALNYGGLANPGLFALNQEAMANIGNYYTLHEQIMEAGYLCPILFQSNAIYARRGAFSGLDPARDQIFYYDLGRSLTDAQMKEE